MSDGAKAASAKLEVQVANHIAKTAKGVKFDKIFNVHRRILTSSAIKTYYFCEIIRFFETPRSIIYQIWNLFFHQVDER